MLTLNRIGITTLILLTGVTLTACAAPKLTHSQANPTSPKLVATKSSSWQPSAAKKQSSDQRSTTETTQRKTSPSTASALTALFADSLVCLTPPGRDLTSYLFGSAHLPLLSELIISPKILSLVKASDVVVLEATMPVIRESATATFRSRKRYDQITPPIDATVDRRVEAALQQQFGTRLPKNWRQRPVTDVMNSLEFLLGLPKRSGPSLDAQIVGAAPDRGIRIIGLEHVSEQIETLNQIPAKTWQNILQAHLDIGQCQDCQRRLLARIKRHARDIASGDWDGIHRDDPDLNDPLTMLTKAFGYPRDQRLASRIGQYLRTDQRSHFIAIGASHIGGPRGVVARLKEDGFKATNNCHN